MDDDHSNVAVLLLKNKAQDLPQHDQINLADDPRSKGMPAPTVTKEQLEKRAAQVRLGGKGTVRRTVKAHHKAAGDDKKVQGVLKKLGVAPINDIDEAIFYKSDGTSMYFAKPKVQASMQSQCFVVSGPYDQKSAADTASLVAATAAAH